MQNTINPGKIRLLAFDIDGTLLDSKHILQEQTRIALKGCQEKGIMVTLATGKNWDAVRALAEQLAIHSPLILSNGALLTDLAGTFYEKITIPSEVMQTIIRVCRQQGNDLVIYLDEQVYIERMTHNLSFLENFGSVGMIEVGQWENLGIRLDEVHKCMAVDREFSQRLMDLEAALRQEAGDTLEYCLAMPEILDLTPKGATKGAGLARLCAELGIPLDAVMAFGDGNNDIDILTEAGIGVSLANGMTQAKACADLLVPSNDRSGPAQLLTYLFDL
jgi:Cof subfamily protein (haloacid dehalogenase superfamily)